MILFIGWMPVYSQDFRKQKLDFKERKEGVIAKYAISLGPQGLGSIILLYKNGKFYYSEGTDMDHVYSTGTWQQKGNTIVFESFFSKSGLSIKINYIDTVDVVQNQLFHIVKNEEGGLLTDALVQINNANIEYYPLGDVYTSKPISVDSVRVRFEKGFVSNWAKVENRPYKALSIIVLTSLDMKNFVQLNQWKFKKMGDLLARIKE
ncbi:MAG: hypothetical protein J7502_15765 [Flavisolibacter sp.]|nr:hypothetical protein [Flavisolibacter sp.]